MKSLVSIAVIGAGLAGLSCAGKLQAAGYRVTVFEKSRAASGRMSTKRGTSKQGEDWQCDTGAQYFTARSAAFQAEVQRWQAAGIAAEWHPEIAVFGNVEPTKAETDTSPVARYVGQPRMTSPARHLAEALTVITDTTVQALRRDNTQWQLCSAEHGWLKESFDAVVLAVPAPQAIPLLKPVHDALAEIAISAPMRGSWALILRYSAPLQLGFDAAFVNTGPLRWIAQNSHKPGRTGQHCWLLHASADWSDAHIEDSAESVAHDLLAAFAELGGLLPESWTAHRWRYADTAHYLRLGAVWQAEDQLGICGDWLNGGKVEGAWLSGQILAEHILAGISEA